MTRKQAVKKAIDILNQQPASREVAEICNKLFEILDSMPITNWDEKTIFDTIDNWIIENHRVPNTKDLAQKGLPPPPVIKNRFGVRAMDFLNEKYPERLPKCKSQKYQYKTKEEWLQIFITEYKQIVPHSAQDFNLRRCKNNPTWSTYAQILEVSTWNELLTLANLPIYTPKKIRGRLENKQINITSISDIQDI